MMDKKLVSVRLARLKDRSVWDRQPPPNPYLDETWELAYDRLKETMKKPDRRFRRNLGLLLDVTWRVERQTVRLIAERSGAIVGYLAFQIEPEFHRVVQARITDWRVETQDGPEIVRAQLLAEARQQAAERRVRWLTIRTRPSPKLEAAGFIEYSRLPGGDEDFGGIGEEWNDRRYVDEVSYYLPTVT